MNILNRKVFEFGGQSVLIDTEWLPHIRLSTDHGTSWESHTDIEFLAERLNLNQNRVSELRTVFNQWAEKQTPVR